MYKYYFVLFLLGQENIIVAFGNKKLKNWFYTTVVSISYGTFSPREQLKKLKKQLFLTTNNFGLRVCWQCWQIHNVPATENFSNSL